MTRFTDGSCEVRYGSVGRTTDRRQAKAHFREYLIECTDGCKEDYRVHCVPEVRICGGHPVKTIRTVVEVRRPCLALMPRTANVINLPIMALKLPARHAKGVLHDARSLQPRLEDII